MSRGSSYNSGGSSALPDGIARWIGAAILVFALIVFASSGTYIVQPGFRGIAVTLGKVSLRFKPEGFGFKQPFVTGIQQCQCGSRRGRCPPNVTLPTCSK